jgi:hypothetical protein
LKGERRTPESRPELDARVEDLTRKIADVVNSASPEQRQDLREYAVGLLKEETEVVEAMPTPSGEPRTSGTNPLGMALLLGVVALPLLLLFAPVGLTLLAVATVMGVWGIVATLVRR